MPWLRINDNAHEYVGLAEPVAEALGISLYAKQLVDGRDRKQLERLARYITVLHSIRRVMEWKGCGRVREFA